jgi:putative nucleotidyltransferase with HDIG domain
VWNLEGAPILGDGSVAAPTAEDLRAVVSGEVAFRESTDADGRPIVDAYVPLRLGMERQVVGVVGARTTADHLRQEIADVRNFLYRTLGGSLTLAFLAMLTVMYLGQRGIRQRERALLARSREIARARHEISLAIVGALDLRDTETEGHSLRVQGLSLAIARALGCTEEEMEIIGLGALLHDIGKIGVSDQVLRKPGPLTDEEWEEIRRHPELGYRFLRRLTIAGAVADIVRAHHERWDGRGYPLGLAGEEIPLGARIFAVADAFDAMTSNRPYRRARTRDEAIAEIVRCSGTQFDPRVVEAFLQVTGAREASELALAA